MSKNEFPYSEVVDSDGHLLPVYHGTVADFSQFNTKMTVDGGFHFGTVEQAKMRSAGNSPKRLIEAVLNIKKPRRLTDTGGGWKSKIQAARRAGFDGIVYLNRFEGIQNDSLLRALDSGLDLDKLSDARFRISFPEARDSWIVFDRHQIKIRQELNLLPNQGLTLMDSPLAPAAEKKSGRRSSSPG